MDLLIISSFAFLWDFYDFYDLYIVITQFFCAYSTILVLKFIFNINPYYYILEVFVSNERMKELEWWKVKYEEYGMISRSDKYRVQFEIKLMYYHFKKCKKLKNFLILYLKYLFSYATQ